MGCPLTLEENVTHPLFSRIRLTTGGRCVVIIRTLVKERKRLVDCVQKLSFLSDCLEEKLSPRSLWFKLPGRFDFNVGLKWLVTKKMIHLELRAIKELKQKTTVDVRLRYVVIANLIGDLGLRARVFDFIEKSIEAYKIKSLEISFGRLQRLRKLYGKDSEKMERFEIDPVVNLSSATLTASQHSVLSKGLNFAVTPQVVPKRDIIAGVECAIIGLSTEQKACVRNSVSKVLKKRYHRSPNISRLEKEAISSLRSNQEIIVLPADKGNRVVILNFYDYLDKLRDIVNNGPYKLVQRNPGSNIRRTLHSKLRKIELDGRLDRQKVLSWCPTFFQTPFLFGLPKIHKNGCPLRPVISQIDSIFSGLSRYMSTLLKDFVMDSPSFIKDSVDVKAKLLTASDIHTGVLVSFDVESLFTNVPVDGILDALKWYIDRYPEFSSNCPFTMVEFLELIEFLLRNCYFEFDGHIYVQVEGVSMGSSLGPATANIYMNFFEYKTFRLAKELSVDIPTMWYRYVDDVLACWSFPEEHLHMFLGFINSQVDSVKFTMEVEKEGKIPFLDLCIDRSGDTPMFSVHRKPTHSNLYLNRSSCHPSSVFPGLIRSLSLRASRLCSDSTLEDELRTIKSILVANGFRGTEVDRHMSLSDDTHKRPALPPVTSSIPFVPGVSNVIKSKLAEFGIDIALKPSRTLGSLVTRKRPSPALCLGSVYQVNCGENNCTFSYVGESARPIDKRKMEHIRNIRDMDTDRSEMAKHVMESGHSIDIDSMKVIDRESCWRKRIVKESLWTRKLDSSNKTKIDLGSFYNDIV